MLSHCRDTCVSSCANTVINHTKAVLQWWLEGVDPCKGDFISNKQLQSLLDFQKDLTINYTLMIVSKCEAVNLLVSLESSSLVKVSDQQIKERWVNVSLNCCIFAELPLTLVCRYQLQPSTNVQLPPSRWQWEWGKSLQHRLLHSCHQWHRQHHG